MSPTAAVTPAAAMVWSASSEEEEEEGPTISPAPSLTNNDEYVVHLFQCVQAAAIGNSHMLDIQNVDTGQREQEIDHGAWIYFTWLSDNRDRLIEVIEIAVLANRLMACQRSSRHHCSDLQHRKRRSRYGVDTHNT
jgi:hypothetical protein